MKKGCGRIADAFEEFDEETIKSFINKKETKRGLKQYLAIQRTVFITDVSKDQLFQEMFSNFYKVDPVRPLEWKKEFFSLFEEYKYKNISFEKIIKLLHNKTKCFEPSFASKLVATVDPKMPVIDSVIIGNLGYTALYASMRGEDTETRLTSAIELYQQLISDFDEFLSTKYGQAIIKFFRKEYPYANINEVKIIDLILWQMR